MDQLAVISGFRRAFYEEERWINEISSLRICVLQIFHTCLAG